MLKKRPSSHRNQGFSQKDLIYLITPDRFANSDPENDSINRLKESSDRKSKYGRHGGDIAGVIDNLDYNPEFLREKHAFEDFENSEMIIFGGEKATTKKVSECFKNHSRCK